MKTIEHELIKLASEFSRSGQETILYENFGKHVQETRLILNQLPDGGRILDVGGGDAVNLILLDRLGTKSAKVLIDNFVDAPDGNRMGPGPRPLPVTRAADIEIITHDFWKTPVLPFCDAAFDLVSILDVLEHLPGSPMALLREVHRVIKPQGTLVLGGPNATALVRRVELLLGKHPYIAFEPWIKPGYVSHFREYTPSEYRALLEKSSFSVRSCELVLEPTATRAKNRYHNRIYPRRSPVAWALWSVYLVERLIPRLRPVVSIVAEPLPR